MVEPDRGSGIAIIADDTALRIDLGQPRDVQYGEALPEGRVGYPQRENGQRQARNGANGKITVA